MLLADSGKIREFRRRIIEWYRVHGDRGLPWRNTSNAWAILVAALLLRKTTTKQVIKVYEEFIKRYPSPKALLNAEENEVKEVIRPLGIEHQRTRHLIELARLVEEKLGGRIPCDKEKLKKLPGVGDYIASEVLLGACDRPEPLLDRNMIRVIERVFSVKSAKKRPHTDPKLWAFAKMLVPKDPESARDFNYGVLDFARKVCTARSPKCSECPVRDICSYYFEDRSKKQA
ncbi:glycosylase [Pyrodictium occultum]|uniref:thymine-DNA glycosylase n=1 Tax=Pyrodictium occultum TaxID=2309 RepID=A0A0V8RW33_PYROC|nr:A/G-specific adenine glycosylase [Pyrodictium occultum]KSW12281.1 glycosylase [Pyrodictium occultum]